MQAMISFPHLFVTLLIVLSIAIRPTDSARGTSAKSSTLSPQSEETPSSTKHHDDLEQFEEPFVDESRTRRAAYQHEQALLAEIYSPERHYVSVYDDRIHPSNFTYFVFKSPGNYRLILISSKGDADLYISTQHQHVSYDNYDISSCTCGIDEILINARMKRPIYVGVYGYSQYHISTYRLLIELVSSQPTSAETIDEASNNDRNSYDAHEQSKFSADEKRSDIHGKTSDDSTLTIWDIFLGLINLLVEILG